MNPAPKPSGSPTTVQKLTDLWFSLGIGLQLAIVAAFVGLLLLGLIIVIRKLGKRGRWGLFVGLTIFLGVCAVGSAVWAAQLPEPKGGLFVLWHQGVRVVAALATTMFILSCVLLAIPWMFNRFERRSATLFVAVRHVRAKKSGFLTVISVLSTLGVLVSSLALCVVISIMGGFGADLKRKILGNNAHMRIEAQKPGGFDYWREVLDDVRVVKGVQAATPVASGEAMASSSSNTAGVIIKGIDPTSIGSVIDLLGNIEVGKFGYLEDPSKLLKLPPEEVIGIGPGGQRYLKGPDFKPFKKDIDPDVEDAVVPDDLYPGLIIGRELAKSLHVYVGDEVTLVSPLGDLGPMGVLPRSQKFRVAAMFYSGMYEYDSSHAYSLLPVAQEFLDMGHLVTAVEVKAKNSEAVSDVRPLVEQALASRKDLKVQDWKQLNRNLFNALQLEKIATFVILMLAIIVASFCIICTLLLMVTEKSKEIAILKAIGASDIVIRNIFILEGVIIGGIGTILGVTFGFVAMKGLEAFGFRLDPDVYYVDRLPIEVNLVDYGLVALCALGITTIATLYPAYAASRLRPVDGIRYE